MNGRERGWLLLCGELGTRQRPLTLSQVKQLRHRVRSTLPPEEPERELTLEYLQKLGYGTETAYRIHALLSREAELDACLDAARQYQIEPMTPASPDYPSALRKRLGWNMPPVLFLRGDRSLLQKRAVSLTGSRQLSEPNRAFAEKVGRLAAREGYVLISGNAPGADTVAQEACLEAGGSVISVLPDSLADHAPASGQLLLCEDGWQLSFSSERALRRNRLIYALAGLRLVAQTSAGCGGTWRGATEALRQKLSVFVCDDGSEGAQALAGQGAELLPAEKLQELSTLRPGRPTLFSEI